MAIGELIRRFSTHTVVPVKIQHVANEIIATGVQDEIEFIPVEYNTGIVRAHLHRYTYRPGVYADPVFRADVYFAINQPRYWQRMATCKELLHLLDPSILQTSTRTEVEALVSKIVVPPQFQDVAAKIHEDGVQVWNDRLADIRAAAVLFPLAVREQLRPKLLCGALDLHDIALLLEIPRRYVQLVMLDEWPGLHNSLLKFG